MSGSEALEAVRAAANGFELATKSSPLLNLVTKNAEQGDTTARDVQSRVDQLKRTTAQVRSLLEVRQRNNGHSSEASRAELKILAEIESMFKVGREQLDSFNRQLEKAIWADQGFFGTARDTFRLAVTPSIIPGLKEDINVYIGALILLIDLLQALYAQRGDATRQQIQVYGEERSESHKGMLDGISRGIDQMKGRMQLRNLHRIRSLEQSFTSKDLVDHLSSHMSKMIGTAMDIKSTLYHLDTVSLRTNAQTRPILGSTNSSSRISIPDTTHIEPLKELAQRFRSKANSDFRRNHYQSAEFHLLESFKCFEELHDYHGVPFVSYGEMKMRLGLIYQHQQKISGARKIWEAAHGNPITYSPEPGWKKVEHNLAEEQARSLAQGYQSEANTFLQQYQLDERQSYLEAAESSAKRAFLLQRDILSLTDPEFLSTVGLLVLVYSKNDGRRIYEKTYRHLYLSSDGIKHTLVLPNSRISAATSTGSPSIVTSINSSISEAVKKHNDDEVERLLSIISTESSKEVTAAFMHAIDCGCEKCDDYIGNLLDRDFDCTVPFTYAVKKSRLEHCKLFLVQGADINHVDAALLTPLMHAVKREDVRTVAFLMGNKADINIQGESARTALHFAIRAGDRAVFEKLLTAGWDQLNADIQDKDGLTALHECAKQNNVEFARRILRIDANPEIRDGSNKHRSPLWIAVKEDKYDFVKMLLECGAEVDLDYLPSGSRDIRKLLKQHSGQVQLTAAGSARRRRRFLNFGRYGGSTSLA